MRSLVWFGVVQLMCVQGKERGLLRLVDNNLSITNHAFLGSVALYIGLKRALKHTDTKGIYTKTIKV
jgi:hypothetical protein